MILLGNTLELPKTRVFHGWYVVAGAFAVMFITFGNAYTFATFLSSLQAEFDVSRGAVSAIFSAAGFLYFLLGAVSGPLADRTGPRPVIMFGMVVVGLGMILAGNAGSFAAVALSYGIGIGVGVGFAYVPAIGAVQRWFVLRRGLASGLAVAGIGLGTLLMPPVASLLIEWAGWRMAYVVLGSVTLVAGVLVTLPIEQSPQRRGLLPDGQAATARPAAAPHVPEGSGDLRQALRSRPFRLLYVASLLVSVGLFIPFVHLVPYAEDMGIPSPTAVLLLGLIGIGSTAGRFLLGSIADRLGRRRSLAGMFLGTTVMLGWWAASTTVWQLAVFALIFGTCYGGFVALLPALTSDYFGGRNVSGIIGMLYTSVAFGTLLGPALAGFAFDYTGAYIVPIGASILAGLLGVGCVLALPEPAPGG